MRMILSQVLAVSMLGTQAVVSITTHFWSAMLREDCASVTMTAMFTIIAVQILQ